MLWFEFRDPLEKHQLFNFLLKFFIKKSTFNGDVLLNNDSNGFIISFFVKQL
jgi:hypothetical protein